MKLAFCAIVKGADEEAQPLERLLGSVAPHVDGIFITITQPNDAVRLVAESFNANISNFEWCNDFSAARNFNFAQVPEDYDYILWGDADDTFDNLSLLKGTLEEHAKDAYFMWYCYAHDEHGVPTVVHPKTMVVKRGVFEWKGKVHEDLSPKRQISSYMLEDIRRIHHTNETRATESAKRNLEIALTEDESDPRTWWNRASAYIGAGKDDEAIAANDIFLSMSRSDAEKYMALLRNADVYHHKNNITKAVEEIKKAIATRYDWPDAYFALGKMLIIQKKLTEARDAILQGITKKPPVYQMVAYNPRDYDYNPLMLLAKVYWELGRPDQALSCLEGCKKIQPKNDNLDKMIETAQDETDRYDTVLKAWKKLSAFKRKGSAKKLYDSLPTDIQNHPLIMHWHNTTFIKETSSGKDVVYFCGMSHENWNPDSAKTGIGGSEEAVILLTREWAKMGYNVTVYAGSDEPKEYEGVKWLPYWLYNTRDKQDITILWRLPQTVDYNINSTKVYLDLHDTIEAEELTKERVAKIDKIFVKSKAHRILYPDLPDSKFFIVNNPIELSLFNGIVERDPFLIINTSSPERSLEACCRIFRKVKEREPRAKMQWAYGWNNFDAIRSDEPKAMQWKQAVSEYMEVLGIENLGRISHEEVAKLYRKAKVFLYPTRFYEIDCISARKAQIAGANVVSSDFAALDETVVLGTKIHAVPSAVTNIELSDAEENDEKYVEAVLEAFNKENKHLHASEFAPNNIAIKWIKVWES